VIVIEGTEANQVRSLVLELDPARLRQPLQGDFSLQPLDLTLRDARRARRLWFARFRAFSESLVGSFFA